MADFETRPAELLRIDTVLPPQERAFGRDPLLLARLQGNEGVSMPYSFDLTMYRPNTLSDIEPAALIGTACAISINIRGEDDPQGAEFVTRKGVFEHVERVSGDLRDLRIYYGRVVPAFKLTGNEIRYRVFENQDPVQIIEQTLADFAHLRFNTALLRQEVLPKLEYCVQFGETTFAFVSRIMARFGMWYMFDHESDAQNETLVIGRSHVGAFNNARLAMVDLLDKRPDRSVAVYNFIRKYDPATSLVTTGNANPLRPLEPFTGSAKVLDDYAVADRATAQRFSRSSFSDPVLSGPEAVDYAKSILQRDEAAVYTVTGDSNNPSFLAGRTFIISSDQTNDTSADADVPSGRIFGTGQPKYLITYLSILASVGHIGHAVFTTVADLWKDLTKTVGTGDTEDVTAGITNGMVSNYLSNQQQTAWTNLYYGGAESVKFWPSLSTGVVISVAGLLPSLIAAVKDVAQGHSSAYGNSFVAVPFNPQRFALPPPAAAPRPIAHGPHLAVVIGPDGVSSTGDYDIFADALGRVRVRFPWDPGPAEAAVGRFQSGNNTCWVRVSEGWAGAGYGTQFLPRIGQQVLVGFIDGDPEQPIVIGRIYAASRGPTDLPFPSSAAQGKGLTIDDWRRPQGSSNLQRSGIKTRSTPSPDGPGAGFHLLRLDDTKGQERFLIRSQGRRDDTSFHSRYETTNGNRHVLVRAGKEANGSSSGGGAFMSVGGENDLVVGDNQYITIKGKYHYSVTGLEVAAAAGFLAYAKNNFEVNGASVIIEAKDKVSLSVGSSSVVITPSAIYIDAPLVKINSGGSPDKVGDTSITDAAGAAQADPGDPPNWLALQPKGGHGGSRTHALSAQHGLPVTSLPDGRLRLGNGPVIVDPNAPGADATFLDGVTRDYVAWKQQPDSDALEQRIAGTGKAVTITPVTPGAPPNVASSVALDPDAARPVADGGTGTGSSTDISYDPGGYPSGGPARGDVFDLGMQAADQNAQGTADHPDNGWEIQPAGPPGSPPPSLPP